MISVFFYRFFALGKSNEDTPRSAAEFMIFYLLIFLYRYSMIELQNMGNRSGESNHLPTDCPKLYFNERG